MGTQLLATGPGKAGRNPPPAQRMPTSNADACAPANAASGAGSPRCVGSRVDLAAWGSQSGTACRQNGCVPTSTVTGWPWKKVCGRRRVAHRRSRAGSPLPLGVRRDEYAGDARSPAREAGRGDRTVAPCPRPAVRPGLASTERYASVRGVHPIGRLYRCVAIRRNATRTPDETRGHAWC